MGNFRRQERVDGAPEANRYCCGCRCSHRRAPGDPARPRAYRRRRRRLGLRPAAGPPKSVAMVPLAAYRHRAVHHRRRSRTSGDRGDRRTIWACRARSRYAAKESTNAPVVMPSAMTIASASAASNAPSWMRAARRLKSFVIGFFLPWVPGLGLRRVASRWGSF